MKTRKLRAKNITNRVLLSVYSNSMNVKKVIQSLKPFLVIKHK